MRAILSILLLSCVRLAWATCDTGLPPDGSRDDVLVIVNDNAVDACEVGLHYAEKRNLGFDDMLHIKAPVSYFVDWAQFEIIREQVFRGLLERISAADPTFTPASCAPSGSAYCEASVAQVRARTGVKVLVTTWGMPSKVVGTPGTPPAVGTNNNGLDPSSLDDYLRMSMVNYVTTYNTYPNSIYSVRRTQIEATGPRPVNPAVDEELIIGRIDSITADGAKALVDRALSAEKNGLFGKAFWDMGGDFDGRFPLWLYKPVANGYVNETMSSVADAWRYVFGVFDEASNQCVGYTAPFYLKNGTEAPAACKVKMVSTDHIGQPSSLATTVDKALLYIGELDGQPTYNINDPFSRLLNWQKAAEVAGAPVTCGMCQDAACRAASTDVFKEIDTRCAGVAEGFVGYNYQSWPLAYLASWPTGWYAPYTGVSTLHEPIGGDVAYLAQPEVVSDSADGVGGALYFGQSKKVAASVNCFSGRDLATQAPCAHKHQMIFGQSIGFTAFNYAAGLEYELKFKYKKTAAWSSANSLTFALQMNAREPTSGAAYKAYAYGGGTVSIGASACVGSWCQATLNVVLNPATASHAVDSSAYTGISYNGLKLIFTTSQMQGDLLLDDFSLTRKVGGVATAVVLKNPSFDGGHQQFATGDFGASYLSRLNGTAFFGSMAHHKTGGSSFVGTAGDSIMRLYQGMPLGEAVWFGNGGGGSGVLYGDPLFSPMAVSFDRPSVQPIYDLGSPISLSGTARNGTDPAKTTTTYSIDYCLGADFMICDRNGGWVATGITGAGTTGPATFGSFSLPNGTSGSNMVLRLNVTAVRVGSPGDTSVFHDFVRTKAIHLAGDDDGDGLIGSVEVALGTDPVLGDTDADGVADNLELQHGFNPLVRDTLDSDKDGMIDALEVAWGSNPNDIDSDGDGYPDVAEWSAAGNTAATINDPSLHPAFGIAPIPKLARGGQLYRHTLVGATPATTVALNVFGIKIQSGDLVWTPSTVIVANSAINVKFANPTAWYQIVVIQLDGDINEDGKLNLADLLLMKRFVTGEVQPTTRQIYHADFYPLSESGGVPDNKLDLSDLIVMEKKLLANPQ